jgi:hypothetical protein
MPAWGYVLAVALGLLNAGCALERSQLAQDAQRKMVGLTKEQVLTCMGPPAGRMAEGATEVWSYNSGNGRTTVISSANANTTASAVSSGGFVTGQASTTGSGVAVGTSRHCTVNVVMSEGRVSRVNYVGPTGGLLTAGEQCAFAVQNCVQ